MSFLGNENRRAVIEDFSTSIILWIIFIILALVGLYLMYKRLVH